MRSLEERAFNAWPAQQNVIVGGWLLRYAGGITKRANSVNALAPTGRFAEVQAFAEDFYGARGLATIFRLTPLAGEEADPLLAESGYRRVDPCQVMTTAIGPGLCADDEISILPTADDAWCAGYAAANGIAPHQIGGHTRILQSIALPCAYALLRSRGQPVACGLAVAERGMIGLFDIATLPAFRRQGAGRRVVDSLLAWGRSQGAGEAYLQVFADNEPAQRLYEGLGFTERYAYHYRVKP